MKKRNRVLTGLLAILLVLTSFTWPSGNTMTANADDGSATPSEVTPYEKLYLGFDDVDLTALEEKGFTSTQFDKNNNYAIVGTADQKVSDHWFAGKTGTDASGASLTSGNTGLKVNTKDSQKRATLLNTPYTYENFHVKTEIYWGVNAGVVFGEKNVYPRNTSDYAAVSVYFANNRIQLGGALDYSTAKVTGRQNGWSSSGNVGIFYFADKFTAKNNTAYTLNVRLQDNVLSVWVDGYATMLTVNVAAHYKTGAVALMHHKYDGDGGGFKSFEIADLNAEGYNDFDNIAVSELETKGFTSTQFNKNEGYALVGEADQKVSSHWVSGNTTLTSGNTGLKSNFTDSQKRATFLNTPYAYENFKISTEIYWGVNAGVILGEKNVYPRNVADYSAISVYFANNRIQLGGALNFSTAKVTGEDAGTWSVYQTNTGIFVFNKAFSGSNPAKTNSVYDLNVELYDGILTVWVEGYDAVLTVNVAKHYKAEAISLMHHKRDGDGGAFKSFAIKEIPRAEVKVAQAGEGFSKTFTDSEFKVSDLNEEFSGYYFKTTTEQAKRLEPTLLWSKTNTGLKPTHKDSDGERTLLTYDPLSFRNVEITTKYQRNWTQYGVMIAPEGQLAAAANNGIRVNVESEGIVKIVGAIDAGSAFATGRYIKINGASDSVAGFNIPDYANKATDKFYNLHVKVDGKVLSVWMDEFPEYVITMNVTDAYQGGMVSLYSTGNQSGGFGTFKAMELNAQEDDANIYTQSFSAIQSVDELTDFTAYTLDDVKNTPVQAGISELFRYYRGRVQAVNAEAGKEDKTNLAILTLNNKTYKNFELTLHYEQARMNRYGVMFGTEPGRFAYTEANSRLVSNGGSYVFTEAEGYRNIKGSLYASFYTSAASLLHRDRGDEKLNSFWWHNNDVMNNVQQKTLHKMTIRVVGEYMTMLIDNDESSRVTVRLADYNGGYISLVSDAAAHEYGGFAYLSVEELAEDASLEAETPDVSNGFETMEQVEELFDAYYLTDAKESGKLEKVNLKEHWWLNNGGFLSRTTTSSGYTVEKDVEVLTYTKQTFTDFEMTYTFQQNWLRLGVSIGEDLGEYPIFYENGKLTADKGALIYFEAEGYTNIQGHLNNTTTKNTLLYRVSRPAPEGFKDKNGKVDSNISAKKEHTVKIVVKDRALYVFLDGNTEAAAYTHLGENYKGGYVSLIAHSARTFGFNNFSISDKVATTLPKGGGVSSSGNTVTADFNTAKFDDSAFTTYYMEQTKGNADGSMKKQNFEQQWTINNGTLSPNNRITAPSSSNLGKFEYDDSTRVAVLTYNKKMTDFIVSYDYAKTPQRMMFMFGTEMGKFALNAPNTTQHGQGVLIYPENDLGAGGGLCAFGNLDTYYSSMRPSARTVVKLDGYHTKGQWASNVGTMHTMTVAVINNHCYIYLDDYGMIADYQLRDYKGGYISLATTGRAGTIKYDNLKITDLSGMSANAVVSAETPKDIVATVGTDISALGLPATVKVKLKNGSTVQAPVEWVPLQYKADEEGVYQFTAVVGGNNPASVGVRQYVKLYNKIPTTRAGVKEWTFDTPSDLKDFSVAYLKNAETGYTTKDIPNWYVSSAGKLTRDPFRAVAGDQYKELGIITYKGQKYKNFELEVEYSQQWQRMMVMFGSDKAGTGAYIDLKDIYAQANPVAGFVEMEGTRNFIGNLINANFDSNNKEKINNARESGQRIDDYYDKVLSGGNAGKKHTMKLRVVGDQAYMWIDNCKEPYVCTLTNYDGGYISLVSTAKTGTFDNLKITRLNDNGEVDVKGRDAAANGTMNVSIDKNASTKFVVPERAKADGYDETVPSSEVPVVAYVLGGSIILLSALIGAMLLLAARKKKKVGLEERGE